MTITRTQKETIKSDNLDLFSDKDNSNHETGRNDQSLPDLDQLQELYDHLNWQYFGGRLPLVEIEWSTRMRAAGKFIPVYNLIRLGRRYHEYYPADVEDTLKHEMLHILYPNHGKEFKAEAKRIGTSRHAKNYPGGHSPHKYIYICPGCGQKYYRHRYIRTASCGTCAPHGFDKRFKLKLFWSAKKEKSK